ncbi:hypothetical protein IQ268_26870 [Oculatella sp. LEGE 06141]|uniref:hypothetical protein n=1 Tax=Oculatella sp. LEGE 06141 TaxID=1828648 RepID=UPI0018830CB7|nr:hypothetical protein [Oculatella sp. LEGE 06141]MBE9182194.1 hypothetical protein [Oculatella sp. LEGE 06141]
MKLIPESRRAGSEQRQQGMAIAEHSVDNVSVVPAILIRMLRPYTYRTIKSDF